MAGFIHRSWLLILLAVAKVVLLLALVRMMGAQSKKAAGIEQKLHAVASRLLGQVDDSRRRD